MGGQLRYADGSPVAEGTYLARMVDDFRHMPWETVRRLIGREIVAFLDERAAAPIDWDALAEVDLDDPPDGAWQWPFVDEGLLLQARKHALHIIAAAQCARETADEARDLDDCCGIPYRFRQWATPDGYQAACRRVVDDTHKGDLVNGALGLCGESGEVADLVKKHLYQGHELDKGRVVEELGDVAWYLAIAADAVGVPLGDVLRGNVEKLWKRYPDGFSAERSVNREG